VAVARPGGDGRGGDGIGGERPVRIGLLGPLTVTVDGSDVPVGGPTQRRLTAALAMAAVAGSALTVANLIDEVYGEELPPRPRRSLATLVWRLRQRWGSDSVAFDGYAYRLDADCCVVDAAEFENLVYQGRSLARAGDDADAVRTLRAALALWRDPHEPDPGLPDPERVRLIELRLGAMDRLAQLLAQSGRPGAAIELLERIVELRPDWEHSQAQLVDCHLDSGAIADGLRVYDRARRTLMEQGVDPGPDLERVAARLAATSEPAAPTAGRRLPRRRRPELPPQRFDGSAEPGELVGRSAERERVTGTVTATLAARRSTAVVISGEPGVGKTTLARAVIAELARGDGPPSVLTLACDPRRTLPYAPFTALAEDSDDDPLTDLLLGRMAGPDGGDIGGAAGIVDAGQVHAALVERIRSHAGPGLVLLVEDLHWASGETVAGLAAALAGTVDLPVAVIATSRDTAIPAELSSHLGCHVRLRGLDVGAVAELLGAGIGEDEVRRLHRLTGGNPLYVHQMSKGGWAGTTTPPDGVEAAIGTHLSIIPPQVRDALEIASVIGDRFTLAVLMAVTGELRQTRPVWIERLTAARRLGLVEPDAESSGEFMFVHTLIREHLYRNIPAERRARAHAGIGRALDRIALGRRCPADLLAHHYTRGWPEVTTDEVVDKLAAAARAASVQLDFAQAVVHYRTALDYLAMDPLSDDSTRVAEILGAAAGAAAAAGDLSAANELYESQRSFAEDAGLTGARLYASLGALRTQYARRTGPQVADHLASALDDAAAGGDLRDHAGLVGEALAAVQVYRPHRTQQLLEVLTRSAPELATGLELAVWEHRTVPDQLTSARRLVDDPTADPVAAWLRLWVSEVAVGQRAMDEPPPCSVAPSRADDQTQFDLSQWRIATLIGTGRLSRARRLIDQALAAPRHPDPAENARRMASFYGQRTMLALLDDQLPAAQRSPEMENPTWASRHPIMRYVTAYMLALGGDRDRARELCDDLIDEVVDADIPESDLLPRLMLLTDACLRSSHRAGFEPCLSHLLPHRGEHAIFRFGQYWGTADHSIGQLQFALEDLDAGIVSMRRAVNQFDAVHARLYRPLAERALATALDMRGGSRDRSEARTLRRRADRTDHAIGLTHRIPQPDLVERPVLVPAPRASSA
jgi:DNA-binding SARP family transcriptional activator